MGGQPAGWALPQSPCPPRVARSRPAPPSPPQPVLACWELCPPAAATARRGTDRPLLLGKVRLHGDGQRGGWAQQLEATWALGPEGGSRAMCREGSEGARARSPAPPLACTVQAGDSTHHREGATEFLTLVVKPRAVRTIGLPVLGPAALSTSPMTWPGASGRTSTGSPLTLGHASPWW